MENYYEFYSDLDLAIKALEEARVCAHLAWIDDDTTCEWYDLFNKIDDILDELNDEPFYAKED